MTINFRALTTVDETDLDEIALIYAPSIQLDDDVEIDLDADLDLDVSEV